MRRHGKWLLADAGPATLLFHFGMTGLLKWGDAPHALVSEVPAAMTDLSALEILVGDWRPEVPGVDVGARTTFEWLEGGGFLIQRATVDRPEFPNGVMVIGATGPDGGLQQHYFDSRGVHRVYEMTLENGVWTLWREGPDWPQRYVGEFSDDGNTISGRWERGDALGAPLQHDFDLNYFRTDPGRNRP